MLPSLQTRGTAHGWNIFLERPTPQADEKERERRSKDQKIEKELGAGATDTQNLLLIF